MPDFVVSTVFKADNRVSAAFKKMGKGADKFEKKSTKAFKKSSRSALSFKKLVGGILTAGVISKGFGLLERGVSGVVEEFVSFDDAITAAAAKFDLIPKGTKEFEKLEKTAREVGSTTEFTSAQAAEGLRFLAKAGFETDFAMKSLKSFVDLATASELDFARATDIATDVMGAFQLNTDDTAKRMKNLKMVNDVLSKAVNIANIDMEDLFETMKGAGPIATAAGISIQKFSALAAFIGGAGIKGSLGATALKNAIINLAAPTPKMTKELRKFGITQKFVAKNIKSPVVILEKLRIALKGVGKAQKVAALATIFGKRAAAGMAVSVEGGAKALRKFEDALVNSKDNAEKLAELMRQSLGKRLAELESTAIEVGFKFLDAFKDDIPGAIDKAIEAIRKFDMKSITDQLSSIKKAFKDVDFATTVQEIAKITKAAARTVDVLAKIMPVIEFINDTAALAFQPIVNGIKTLSTVVEFLIDNFGTLKETALDSVFAIKTSLVNVGKGLGGGVSSLVSGFKNLITGEDFDKGQEEIGKKFSPKSLTRPSEELGLVGGLKKAQPESGQQRTAPNAEKEASRRQGMDFKAFLEFQNAPKDLSFAGSSGSPNVQVEGLGTQ